MADPDLKIELGSFVPHFIIYVLWKTPRRQMESGRGKMEGRKLTCLLTGRFSQREVVVAIRILEMGFACYFKKNMVLLISAFVNIYTFERLRESLLCQEIFKACHIGQWMQRIIGVHLDILYRTGIKNETYQIAIPFFFFFLLHSIVFCSPQPACVAAPLSSVTTGSTVSEHFSARLRGNECLSWPMWKSLSIFPQPLTSACDPHHPHNPTSKCYTLPLNNNHNNNLVNWGNSALL